MSLKSIGTFPAQIHWKSDNPLDNATEQTVKLRWERPLEIRWKTALEIHDFRGADFWCAIVQFFAPIRFTPEPRRVGIAIVTAIVIAIVMAIVIGSLLSLAESGASGPAAPRAGRRDKKERRS